MTRSLLAATLVVALAAPLGGCVDDRFGRGFRTADHVRTDEFVQLNPSKADVLWVVDTSCSMEDEQLALVDNFPSFIDFFVERRLDFQMAVTSTNIFEDNSEGLDGRMVGDPAVITGETEDVVGAFLDRALLGIDERHGQEKGLEAAYHAIEMLGSTDNAGFHRDDAHLAIIVVSDEPYMGTPERPTQEELIEWPDFTDWLDDLKGPTGYRMTDFSAIVGIGPDGFDDRTPCGQDEEAETGGQGGPGSPGWGSGAERGDGYLEAAEATGGTWGSICEEDWGEMLGRVGLRAAGLMDNFPLLEVPDVGTLRVMVDGVLTSAWEYREMTNSIRFTSFNSVPRPGQEVNVWYRTEGWDAE
jgi:hypothetical protein